MSWEVSSLPARGAWVETFHGALPTKPARGRSPQGERGLKHIGEETHELGSLSLPARGAWVETRMTRHLPWSSPVAPRKGSVG